MTRVATNANFQSALLDLQRAQGGPVQRVVGEAPAGDKAAEKLPRKKHRRG